VPQPQSNLKFPVPLADGLQVEAVWYPTGTLCLSTQVGCAVGCPFCASGRHGLKRNLGPDELQRQVAACLQWGREPRRLTLSGIGEPLHNFQAVAKFIESQQAGGLPVSLTSCGAPLHHLETALHLPHNGLMLSLHAGTAATHRRLVPQGPDWGDLWGLLQRELPSLSRRRRRKIGINFLVLPEINDRPAELAALADLLAPFPDLTLHLLSLNPIDLKGRSWPAAADLERVANYFLCRGNNVRRANRWRRETEGGCGTLLAGVADRQGLC